MMKKSILLMICLIMTHTSPLQAGEAEKIVKGMFDYMRGKTSVATVKMTIHRPDWQRSMTIKAWTRGDKDSIFFISSPPKDQGNGTLKKGTQMWMYNPKVNQTIKVPPSMMTQSWMGSDFSNNDLAKTDSIIQDYVHTLIDTKEVDGKKVYTIKSMPKPQAPVVWGMQELTIREDNILLGEIYYDQDMKPVKALTCSDIKMIGNRLFATAWKMAESDAKGKYTSLIYEKLEFDIQLKDNLFSVSSLENPRR